jgi:hypothetical protein
MNPLNILKKIKIEYPSHEIKELELLTLAEDGSDHLDIYGALLTLIKNSEEVLADPILFSQVCLGLCGIQPDFQEFEFPASEHIYTFFDFMEKGKIYFPFKAEGATEELKYFISVCLAEEGIYFLKGELEPIQDELLIVYEEVYGNPIPKGDLEICEERWKKYEKMELDKIPEVDDYDIQVKQNIFMKKYAENYLK